MPFVHFTMHSISFPVQTLMSVRVMGTRGAVLWRDRSASTRQGRTSVSASRATSRTGMDASSNQKVRIIEDVQRERSWC
jgi:hypothetical protein